jgi:methyl-accepting chemotaxis protein
MSRGDRLASGRGLWAVGVVAAVATGAVVIHQSVAPALSTARLTRVRLVLAATVGTVAVGVAYRVRRERSAASALLSVRDAGQALATRPVERSPETGAETSEANEGTEPTAPRAVVADLPTERADEVGQVARAMAATADELARRRAALAETEARETELRALRSQADTFAETIAACAAGDTTARLATDVEDDSLRAIAVSYNRAMDELEAVLAEARGFATEVTEQSRTARSATGEIRDASRQVSRAVQRIADGADEQDERVAAVTEAVADLSATTERAATTAEDLAAVADETASQGETGRDQAQVALGGLIQIREATETTVAAIERIADRTDEVSELVDVVDEIATRTNKLALDAKIEATRADDEGPRGFEVIAENVKQLAGDAREELATVEDRIDGIENDTRNAVGDIRAAVEEMDAHSEGIEQTIQTLEEVGSMAAATNEEVQEIRRIAHEQAEAADEVVADVREIDGISAETSEAADRAAAAAREQTAAVDDIVDLTDDLVDRATSLERRLAALNVTADPQRRADEVTTGETGRVTNADADPAVATDSPAGDDRNRSGRPAADAGHGAAETDTTRGEGTEAAGAEGGGSTPSPPAPGDGDGPAPDDHADGPGSARAPPEADAGSAVRGRVPPPGVGAFGARLAVKTPAGVETRTVGSDDVSESFEAAMRWYAARLDPEAAPEEVLETLFAATDVDLGAATDEREPERGPRAVDDR